MRISTIDPKPELSAENHTGGTYWTARTPSDFKSLLLELARAQRGFLFYGETDSRRGDLANRAHRALTNDIDRCGPIDFSLETGGFQSLGGIAPVDATGPLAELAEAFRQHGLSRIRLDSGLTDTALSGFLDQLGHTAERYADPDCFVRTLVARDCQGLQINDLSNVGRPTRIRLSSTPPRASASLASSHLPREAGNRNSHTIAATQHAPKLTFEDAPLEAIAQNDRGERLRARLVELQATIGDAEYRERVSNIVAWAKDLWNDEAFDDYYRALLVVADHAVGGGGRSENQARAAAASFADLANTERLSDLIRRATLNSGSAASRASIRAVQLLLQLGQVAVPAIFDRLCIEEDPNRAAPLRALILTQGDAALPHLIAAIEGKNADRARKGIRLAGELQNPIVLPILLRTLPGKELARRVETIRALSLLPGEESKRALTEALTSDLDEIASAASEALASADGEGCVPTLLDVLEASLHSSRTKFGTTLIRVLGRVGDERAVPRLCAILERRPVLRRAHWHALQLAAVDALAVLPTKEARRTLERAALHGALPIRDRARALLDRTA